MARRLDAIGRLWDALDGFDVGFCLDTCHAHAGGIELLDAVDRVKAITGRIDLVHANDSKDAFDSGATGTPTSGPEPSTRPSWSPWWRAAGAPVVCETPGGADGPGRRHRVPARAAARLTRRRPRSGDGSAAARRP